MGMSPLLDLEAEALLGVHSLLDGRLAFVAQVVPTNIDLCNKHTHTYVCEAKEQGMLTLTSVSEALLTSFDKFGGNGTFLFLDLEVEALLAAHSLLDDRLALVAQVVITNIKLCIAHTPAFSMGSEGAGHCSYSPRSARH